MKIEHRSYSTLSRETHIFVLGLHIELYRTKASSEGKFCLAWVDSPQGRAFWDDKEDDETVYSFVRRHLAEAVSMKWAGL